ncbi:ribosomal RNA small subunit methyltransferase G [Leptospira ryugenii]|uniref:Ribosomal RNA small subunit methyltransferase G n=1 Tax=Leptospira ryugenii TaxID=1917863 RepID=A0A2P2E3A0_9LEPT|nr:RsmG family class I SAM-dependent methyltransferase [Leptospira ryugenii]GBF51339.1 ribosomal RNA small subunit methyltransferase G [Leptospira ryugenii]
MSAEKYQDKIIQLLPTIAGEILTDFRWDLVSLFETFLQRENERGGFFSKRDSELIFDRHIIDCLLFVWYLKREGYVSRETKVADVGTGPGLPGFLFQCLQEPPQLTLIDSQRRKLSLLEGEYLANLSLYGEPKIHFLYARAEEVESTFDLVTLRAVIPYPYSAELCCRLTKTQGLLCPYLGQSSVAVDLEKEVLQNQGFVLKKEIAIEELSFLGKRHIKILQKNSKPKPGYPRPWKEIVKDTKG